MEARRLDAQGWLLCILGVGMLTNALWMLVGPMHWYQELPAAVPDTGPFNAHFVRDIGCAFLAIGGALTWAALEPGTRRPLVVVSALFLTAHALLHAYDTTRGALDASHWGLDFLGVYLPALLVLASARWLLRGKDDENETSQ